VSDTPDTPGTPDVPDVPDVPVTPSPSLRADVLAGRWFTLTPIHPAHHRALYELAFRGQNSFRWRYRGAMPTFSAFEQSLYAGVLCQFVVCPVDEPQRVVGLVVAYNSSPQDDTCYLAAVMDDRVRTGGVEAVALFVRYLFRHWPLRKVYLESVAFNVPQFVSAVRRGLFIEEGRLRHHHYFDGRHWDLFIYALYRDDAEGFATHLGVPFDAGDAGARATPRPRPNSPPGPAARISAPSRWR
jgi:RimJ/RimL family protein N-acetyltransferase